jgi:hypothetical protein
MKSLSRFFSIFTMISIAFLAFGVQNASALPTAPVPLTPAEGSTIIIPTFTWQASLGAAIYEVEVGPQSDPNLVYWTGQTVNLTLTPNAANEFANIPLYWRVRALDSSDNPGAWSNKINFTKHIPAPTLLSPADTSTIITPVFEWQTVEGAAYYQVELSSSSTFLVVDDTYLSYNTRVIPTITITHGIHYWRVSGVDTAGHVGTPSAVWSFTKNSPAPTLVSPTNGHSNIHIPRLEWQAVAGAAYYKVELSTSSTFLPVNETYTTYNTSMTPVDTIAHGLTYWRVSSVDAGGHVGTPHTGWSFTKTTDAPALFNPGVNAVITVPTMEWAAVDGAAYYRVELSTSIDFLPILETYNTYNLQITPVDILTPGTYYWRVSGVDAGGNVGGYNWRRFTLNSPPAAIDPIPQLISPANAATITTDPTFSWTRSVGAATYRLIVSKEADLSPIYDSVITNYDSYTPYTAGSFDAFPNDTYYWEVQARNSGGSVIATSAVRTFTKAELLPLVAPENGATGLVADPTFEWNQIVGAKTYRLIVSKEPDLSPIYDTIITDYTSYTPYTAGSLDGYPNDTYYWQVEARNSGGTIIATSEARSLTKQEPLPLIAPVDGALGLLVDPTFEWNQIVGAKTYRLIVSKDPSLSPIYDTIITDYTSYTPDTDGSYDAYPNDTYYWKVEARNSGGTIIATSLARSLTKQETQPLIAPLNGAQLVTDPTFQWSQIVGADTYHLIVSKDPSFSPIYDTIVTDYNSYTPYDVGYLSTYPLDVYYWKVEARNSGGTIITTSNNWSFSKVFKTYLSLINK